MTVQLQTHLLLCFTNTDVFHCHFVFYKLKFCGKLALSADSLFSNKKINVPWFFKICIKYVIVPLIDYCFKIKRSFSIHNVFKVTKVTLMF